LSGSHALHLIDKIGNNNAQKEFYLADVVGIAVEEGLSITALIAPEAEVMGVNDRVQLAQAEALMQARLREQAMRDGATLIAPETVFFHHDTRIGRDVIIEPHVVFGKGVVVCDHAVIHSFSHIEGARIGERASVGPYARLRPGTELGDSARIGNFVEI
jgi:bifunctional UDP-N-acetylglucosamine pyrophosphorylase/glucosamine-1-phosphate N-acetyltransferase